MLEGLHLLSQPPEHTISLCSTDYSLWPLSTFVCHCYKQSCFMHAVQMYHRCIFAQVSSHPTKLDCCCCLFTPLGAGYKFDLTVARIKMLSRAYKLLALLNKCLVSLLVIVANVMIPFFHKMLLIAIHKDIVLYCSYPVTRPFKPIWDKHEG